MGAIIWYELRTDRVEAVRAFYRTVIGWDIGEASPPQPGGPGDYRMIRRSDGSHAGGVLVLDSAMQGLRPGWLVYGAVADVAEAIAQVEARGGRLTMGPVTIAEGTFAEVVDPQGVAIYLMTPQGTGEGGVFAADRPQWASWHDYAADDPEAALAFYRDLWGITSHHAMPMGERGDYRFLEADGQTIGGLMQRQGQEAPGWTVYFRVPDVFVAQGAVAAAGGTVLHPPHPVPGGDWVLRALDPAGARFGLVGSNASLLQAQQQQQQ